MRCLMMYSSANFFCLIVNFFKAHHLAFQIKRTIHNWIIQNQISINSNKKADTLVSTFLH
uniref:Uncharacterized protein n=1 Tax=Siphoviridae sp. ctFKD2 TaxID=2825403 RepID=A0A8S5NXH9_9CAUD|nr:MAG TPA: hypothetical protein [Siphoviridae sp. ctFKD2]